jgi:hypothetical protein
MSEKGKAIRKEIQEMLERNQLSLFLVVKIITDDGKLYIGRVRLKDDEDVCIIRESFHQGSESDIKETEIKTEEISVYRTLSFRELMNIVSHLRGALEEIDEVAPPEIKEMIKVAIDRI